MKTFNCLFCTHKTLNIYKKLKISKQISMCLNHLILYCKLNIKQCRYVIWLSLMKLKILKTLESLGSHLALINLLLKFVIKKHFQFIEDLISLFYKKKLKFAYKSGR